MNKIAPNFASKTIMVLPGHPAYKFPISRALLFLTMYALRNNELISLAIVRRGSFRQSGILSYRISYGRVEGGKRGREGLYVRGSRSGSDDRKIST